MDNRLVEAVIATAEIYGRQMSRMAAEMLLEDLSGFPAEAILSALSRCRKELRTFPTVADILARIEDGRPGVEEAWAMIPKDERDSVVWTGEMSEAFGAIRVLLDSDAVAARMAFKEAYLKLLADARATRKPAKWSVSLGFDKRGREAALRDAVVKGRLSLDYVQAVDPEFQLEAPKRQAIGFDVRNLLPEMPT